MAKKSMIAREARRTAAVAKYAAKRDALKAIISSPDSSFEAVMEAVEKLQKLPRDGSPARQMTRCNLTGRPHAVYRKFGLCRNFLFDSAMRGEVRGRTEASW